MNDKVKGIILSQVDYREADLMMQVASQDYGIITLVAKASKKINSKNHFLPLCLYEFIIDYKDNKNIFTIHGSKLIKKYYDDQDIEMMSYKNIICELALKNKEVNTYDHLVFIFDNMNNKNKYLLGSLFISSLLKYSGIMPEVDKCVLCNSTSVESISNYHGGFVCHNHLNGLDPLPVNRLKKFRILVKAKFDNYKDIIDIEFDKRDFDILMDFYLTNSELKIKSYDLYKVLNI